MGQRFQPAEQQKSSRQVQNHHGKHREKNAPAMPAAEGTNWVAITSGFAMAIASAFCGIAQARATSSACEGLARNPGAAAAIRFALVLSLVLIESIIRPGNEQSGAKWLDLLMLVIAGGR